MEKNSHAIRCPSCQGALVPVALVCDACEIRVEGRFAGNEFASLSAEDLHFLRIFVHCEGRIREMESALGVSYPTIKGRMAKLKAALAGSAAVAAEESAAPVEEDGTGAVLRELEAGQLTFEEAMKKIKELREGDNV